MRGIRYNEAAGQAAKRGRPPLGRSPQKNDFICLYVKEQKSIREVVETLKCSKNMVARTLKWLGIEPRTNIKRSALRKYGLKALKTAARKKGVRGVGVNRIRQSLKASPAAYFYFLPAVPSSFAKRGAGKTHAASYKS